MNAATGGPSENSADGQDGVFSFDGMQDRVAGPGRPAHGAAEPAEEWDVGDDDDLSRLVRPYTLTRGRTRHAEWAAFDVIAQIVAVERTGLSEPVDTADSPEHQAILDLVLDRPLSVAEVAAGTDLPLGVARILLGDLLDADLIRVSRPVPSAELPDSGILLDVLQALRAL